MLSILKFTCLVAFETLSNSITCINLAPKMYSLFPKESHPWSSNLASTLHHDLLFHGFVINHDDFLSPLCLRPTELTVWNRLAIFHLAKFCLFIRICPRKLARLYPVWKEGLHAPLPWSVIPFIFPSWHLSALHHSLFLLFREVNEWAPSLEVLCPSPYLQFSAYYLLVIVST